MLGKPFGLFLIVWLGLFPSLMHAGPTDRSDVRLSSVPIAFETNAGQYRSDIKFVARIPDGTISLTSRGATIAMKGGSSSPVTITPVAGARSVAVEGLEETEGKSNYFLGSDPSKWIKDVARYSRVRYRSVYSGIDLIFHGTHSNVEYDFVVSPRADPSDIEVEFVGASSLELQDGDLIIMTAGEPLIQHAPVLYQESEGVRTKVAGSYILVGKNRVKFRVGSYERTHTLIIDPVVGYSARFGGSAPSLAAAIAVDAGGNVYVAGQAEVISDFPALPGSFETSGANEEVAFVCKLNAAGTDFVYTTLIGGSSGAFATGIAVDNDGNAFVTGSTPSADFPVTSGAFQTTLSSTVNHAFVFKLNPSGSALLYSTFIGGNYPDLANAITIDSTGNAYITGSTDSPTFPVTPGAFQTTMNFGATDAFVTKLNSGGTALIYSTYLGGTSEDAGNGIAVDSSGSAYIAGSASSSNFPVTAGAFETTSGGNVGFVTKLNPTGSGLVYSTFLDAGNGSFASGIAVDSSGSAYVAGTGGASVMGTPKIYAPQGSSGRIFVAKLNSAGSALSYLTSVGGSSSDEQSTGIALDSAGNTYVSGWTTNDDFPLLSPVQLVGPPNVPGESFKTTFVFKLDPTGNLAYSTYFGSAYDTVSAITVDSNANVYLTGIALSTLFPVTPGALDARPPNSSGDVFVAELSSSQTCSFTFSSTLDAETVAGGNNSIDVTAPSGCGWIALSGQPWITITSPSAGSGSGTVSYSVQPNPSPARTGILSIAGASIEVSQPNGCEYSLSAFLVFVPASGGIFPDFMNVTTGSGCPITISDVPSWMTWISTALTGTSGIGFEFSANTSGAPRSAILDIAGFPLIMDQAGGFTCSFSVSPKSLTSPASGSFGTFQVSTSSGCSWAVASDSPWLQVSSISSSLNTSNTIASGNGTVYYTVAENTGTSGRTGTLMIGNKTFTINQAGTSSPAPPFLSIAKQHSGNFLQGQQGAQYTVIVSNASGSAPTNGRVAVAEALPSGLTLASMAGIGWTCPGTTATNCTRSDSLSGGANYPPITVTVNVAADASSPEVNSVTVSGGGSAGANTTDPTIIIVANPDPLVTQLSPTTGSAGGAAFTLKVTGKNFEPNSVVLWGGSGRPTTYVSSTTLRAAITADDIATDGVIAVSVMTPAPGGGTSGTVSFAIKNPRPVLSSLSPPSVIAGSGDFTLIVDGSGFVNGSTVEWNGSNRDTTFVSGTQLSVAITSTDVAIAGTVLVKVSSPTPGGGTSTTKKFTIDNPVPVAISLSPESIDADVPAFTLTVTGNNFVNGSTIVWKAVKLTTTFVNSTQLTALVSASDVIAVGTDNIAVVNRSPGGGTSNKVPFTVNNPVPTLTSVSPSSATVGGASFTLTVKGSHFINGASVLWDGEALETTFVSPTQLRVKIAGSDISSSGTAQVSVSNPAPGGGSSETVSFTIK